MQLTIGINNFYKYVRKGNTIVKKILSIIVCAILCFSLVGCTNDNNNKQNENARNTLIKVLENEQTFFAKTSVVSNNITENKLEKYSFQTYDIVQYAFIPEHYTFADCDADGVDELVVLDQKLSCYLILRYDNKKVYGYNYTPIGDIKKFKSDGSFEPRLKKGEKSISRLLFKDVDFEIVEKAYINETEKIYLLDYKAREPDTVKKIFDAWDNTPQADWTKISS